MADWNMLAGWIGMMCGLISGAAIGLFFHQADFAGGYGAFRRRLLRLGHVAFLGLGIINILFSVTLAGGILHLSHPRVASILLIAGAGLMPAICFLAAWRSPFRHVFVIPVVCVAITIVMVLKGLMSS